MIILTYKLFISKSTNIYFIYELQQETRPTVSGRSTMGAAGPGQVIIQQDHASATPIRTFLSTKLEAI